jgi:hypothetical protein
VFRLIYSGEATRGITGDGAFVLNLLAQFSYLQVLDVLTTLAFLSRGIGEANPIVRFLVSGVGSPLGGLLAAKAIALCLACYCWRKGRERLLGRVNVFYAGLVMWNLTAIVIRATMAG